MRILVTGERGQLVRSLVERGQEHSDFTIMTAARPAVDLQVPGSLAAHIRSVAPDIVVNAAAYTDVDRAEDEAELAFRVNADAAGEAAAAARDIGAPIVQISTDYVFDGSGSGPYREVVKTNPLGVYGQSKLAGEEQVRENNPRALILRTAWVYSPFGRNFVKTMLRLARERSEIAVVADQKGTPTSALDLADAILHLLGRDDPSAWGRTYHFAGATACSWAEFATAIFQTSHAAGGPSATVRPIATADYPTKAQRPTNSVLDSSAFASQFSFPIPDWQTSMPPVVARLIEHSLGS